MKWIIAQNCKCNEQDCNDEHLAMLTNEDGIQVFNSHLEAEAFAECLDDDPEDILIMPQQENM
jgi:hypothetical protein